MKGSPTTLVNVLIGKSIIETLLVGALAVFTFINVLPPYFRGWGEVTERGIEGWAVDSANPWDRVAVQIYIDGNFAAHVIANQPRPDVLAAGWARDQWHGYVVPISNVGSGVHEARVYVLHDSGDGVRKSLQLLGNPIPFVVDSNGKLASQTSAR
jgi:hypothetical protein